MSYLIFAANKQVISKLDRVVIGDVLAIERKRFQITLDSLDLQEDYPKPEPIERLKKVQISGEGQNHTDRLTIESQP